MNWLSSLKRESPPAKSVADRGNGDISKPSPKVASETLNISGDTKDLPANE